MIRSIFTRDGHASAGGDLGGKHHLDRIGCSGELKLERVNTERRIGRHLEVDDQPGVLAAVAHVDRTDTAVFVAHGQPLTRSGIYKIVRRHAAGLDHHRRSSHAAVRRRRADDSIEDAALRRRRLGKNRMKRRDDRHAEIAQQLEDVTARVRSEDAV